MVRIAVFAYHGVGRACLEALLPFGDEIVCVVTHRDRPEEKVWFGSVAELAEARGLPLFFAEDRPPRVTEALAAGRTPEILYSFYYRNLIGEELLRVPRLGAYNLHGSLLPAYRGRCPVNWVILRREKKTGVTLHHMVKQPDAGDVVAQREIPIAPRETARTLYDKIIPAAAELVRKIHPLIREGRAPRVPQDPARASVFPGRRPEDGRIDWRRGAEEIDALVRAVTRPYPGAFTFLQERKVFLWETFPLSGAQGKQPGRVVSLSPLRVETGEGILEVRDGEFAPEEDGAPPLFDTVRPGDRFI